MVSQRVADLFNAAQREGREVDSSLRRNLSSGEQRDLDELQDRAASARVSQEIRITEIKKAEGIPEDQPIPIEAIQPPPERFRGISQEQRREALKRVGAGEERSREQTRLINIQKESKVDVFKKPKEVVVRGEDVFIGGLGFSVEKRRQKEFIIRQTGGSFVISSGDEDFPITQRAEEFTEAPGIEEERKAEKPFLTLEATIIPETFLERSLFKLQQQRQKFKPKFGGIERGGETLEILKQQAGGFLIGAGVSAVGGIIFLKNLIKDPIITTKEIIKSVPQIPEKLGGLGAILKEEPGFATGFVVSEAAQAVILGKTATKLGDVIDIGRTRISTKFRPKVTRKGVQIITEIPTEELGFFRFRGASIRELAGEDIKLFTGKFPITKEIPITKPVKLLKEPLEVQAKLAGTTRDIVSAQTDFFKKTVGLERLERFFFADPRGRLRISRLIGETDGGLRALLSGEITFRRGKKLAFFFEKAEIEQLPKNLAKKLKTGKPLTLAEQEQLLIFQSRPSGKFKPIGKLSLEPEVVTLEIPRKVGDLGVTLVGKGLRQKRVTIIKTELLPPTKEITEVSRAISKGVITKKQIQRLAELTGFKSSEVSGLISPKIFVSPTGLGLSVSSAISKVSRVSVPPSSLRPSGLSQALSKSDISLAPSKPISKPISRLAEDLTPISALPSPISPPPISPGAPPISPPPTPTLRPPVSPPPIIPLTILSLQKQIQRERIKQQGWDVFIKSTKTKKFVKANKNALTKTRARDVRNFLLDTSLSRSGKLKPSRNPPKNSLLDVPFGYGEISSFKFRDFKQVKGKRIKLEPDFVIEKREFLLDTPQEVQDITIEKRLSQIQKRRMKSALNVLS